MGLSRKRFSYQRAAVYSSVWPSEEKNEGQAIKVAAECTKAKLTVAWTDEWARSRVRDSNTEITPFGWGMELKMVLDHEKADDEWNERQQSRILLHGTKKRHYKSHHINIQSFNNGDDKMTQDVL